MMGNRVEFITFGSAHRERGAAAPMLAAATDSRPYRAIRRCRTPQSGDQLAGNATLNGNLGGTKPGRFADGGAGVTQAATRHGTSPISGPV